MMEISGVGGGSGGDQRSPRGELAVSDLLFIGSTNMRVGSPVF